MCPVCNKEGCNRFFCTFCDQFMGCTNAPKRLVEHMADGSCSLQWCAVHKYHNDPIGEHYETCSICTSTYDCGKTCPNNCCTSCATEGYKFCHCDGLCGKKSCKCSKRPIPQHPQHNKRTLVEFGLLVNETSPNLNLMDDAREFYGAMAMFEPGNPSHHAIVSEIAARQAKRFLKAIVVATAGELRSISDSGGRAGLASVWQTYHKKHPKGMSNSEFFFWFDDFYMMSRPRGLGQYVRRLRQRGSEFDSSDGTVRTKSATIFKKWVIDKYGVEVALRHCVNFWRIQGGGGVGGDKWARCAWVGLQYVQGKMTDIEFVDSAYNLQHNNAILFTKTHDIEEKAQKFLDKRRETDPQWLILRAPDDLRKRMGVPEPELTIEPKFTHTVKKTLVTAGGQ